MFFIMVNEMKYIFNQKKYLISQSSRTGLSVKDNQANARVFSVFQIFFYFQHHSAEEEAAELGGKPTYI